MKLLLLLLALSPARASAQSSAYVNFIRQNQQTTGVVWDMPVTSIGSAPSALSIENAGSLFQLWTIQQAKAKDYLLDQKLVGAYLPKADIKITTLDPYTHVPRTRVDQPFNVEIYIDGLLSGAGMPDAATKVLLQRHLQPYAPGQTSLDQALVAANTPLSSAYLNQNGKTVLSFPASSLKAGDPTKATGEEQFVIHALTDGATAETQIASAHVQVWPVASGAILGLSPGHAYRYQMPVVQLNLIDLYPRSDTYFMLYHGTQINGVTGTLVKAFPWDSNNSKTTTLTVSDLDSKFTTDGIYTVALMSETLYGKELLCPPITFSINRTLAVNAMQVNFSDGKSP